jgi:hypothetical protein
MKKKRYIVVPRTEEAKARGIRTGKGDLKFGTKSAQWVDDPVIAKEIDREYGKGGSMDVWVAQDENLEWHEQHDGLTDGRNVGIHHYTFAGVDIAGRGGNERVKVKTKDGFTFVSREVAEEEGYQILPQKRKARRKGAEVQNGSNTIKGHGGNLAQAGTHNRHHGNRRQHNDGH